MTELYEETEIPHTESNPIEDKINEVFNTIIDCVNKRREEIIIAFRQRLKEKLNASVTRVAGLQQLNDMKANLENREVESTLQSMQGRMVDEIGLKINLLQVMERETEVGFDCDVKDIEDSISKFGELIEKDISVPNYATLSQPSISVGKDGTADGEIKWPGGLAYDEKSQLIYVGNGGCAGLGRGRISMFTMSGDFISNFCDGLFNEPVGIAIYKEDLFVTDTYLHCVFKLKLGSFKLIKKVGTNGSGIGEFDCPQKLSLDSDGNVYVADCGNNRVVVMSSDLTHKLHIQHEGMKFPCDVKVNQDIIYVLSFTDDPCLHLFSLTGEKLHSFISCALIGETQVKQSYTFCFDRRANIIIGDHVARHQSIFKNWRTAVGKKTIASKNINPSIL